MQKRMTQEENRRLIEQLKSDISIVDYAQKIGLTIGRVGRYYTTKEHDSIRIDPDRNIYFRNSRDTHKGSIMDFMIEFGNVNNFHEAMLELTSGGYSHHSQSYDTRRTTQSKTVKKEFMLPQRDDNVRNVYAYLINTRKLDKDIVSALMGKGYIKQDTYKNCMFIGYNGDPKDKSAVFACLRGTNTNKPFKGDVPGSDYSNGFYIDNGSHTIVVTESPIDALSYMTLMKINGKDPYQNNYLSLAGVNKYEMLFKRLQTNSNIQTVTLCLDNDDAGRNATAKIVKELEKYPCKVKVIVPKYKDINDSLCNDPFHPFRSSKQKIQIKAPQISTNNFDYCL